jgi:hypothetical protein
MDFRLARRRSFRNLQAARFLRHNPSKRRHLRQLLGHRIQLLDIPEAPPVDSHRLLNILVLSDTNRSLIANSSGTRSLMT